MNKVLLVGRLTKDPFYRSTSNNIPFVRFTLAVNRSYARGVTDFVPIVTWRQSADFVNNYVRKGNRVSVEGSFTSSNYQNAEGNPVTRYEVTADRVQLLETKPRDYSPADNRGVNTKVEGLDNIEFVPDDPAKVEPTPPIAPVTPPQVKGNALKTASKLQPKPSKTTSNNSDPMDDIPWDQEI